MSAPVIIAAGGTGGHVVPALAVAEVLERRGVRVVWLGTRAGLESRLVPAAGLEIRWIDVAGLRGKGLRGALVGPPRLARACLQSLAQLARLRPRAVLGMGGFVAGPVALAALALRRPLVLHEQNAIAGMTNRRLARFAARVLAAWPDAFGDAALRVETIGNPVRRDIAALAADGTARAVADTGARDGVPADAPLASGRPLRLLVVGGSRGARALNETVPAAIARLDRAVRVLHQTGAADAGAVRSRYAASGAAVGESGGTVDAAGGVERGGTIGATDGAESGVTGAATGRGGSAAADGVANARTEVTVEPFVDDMAAAYLDADLVVCRSGAMTVTELAALGRPSILVPFPHAVDDHQSANARALAEAGAAIVIDQAALTDERLAAELARLDGDRDALARMARAARGCFRAGAAEAVADALLDGAGRADLHAASAEGAR